MDHERVEISGPEASILGIDVMLALRSALSWMRVCEVGGEGK